jgi:uncharacterized membrane protein YeaQ/YmgE (transglycosylase-associated protein family)
MSGVGLIGAIIIGVLAGWLAEKIMKRNHGLLTNLVVGLAGALIGGFLAHTLGWDFAGFWASLLVSLAGAVVLLAILGALKRKA